VSGPPYGDSADERARKRREEAAKAREKFHSDWGLWSSPDDEGRRRHQEKARAGGKRPKGGCLDAAGRLVAGTVTAVLAARWYWRTRTSSLR
jgi:hypothetical protein